MKGKTEKTEEGKKNQILPTLRKGKEGNHRFVFGLLFGVTNSQSFETNNFFLSIMVIKASFHFSFL